MYNTKPLPMAEVFAFKEESAKMSKASKRIAPKEFTSKTGAVITEAYCRKCMKTKHPRDFYQAVDTLDSNGIMSICKSCCQEIYDKAYLSERTTSRAFLKVCRTLNVVFDESVVESVLSQISKAGEDGRTARHPFAIYRIRITAMLSRGAKIETEELHDLTFYEPSYISGTEEDMDVLHQSEFWGDMPLDDIEFLEKKFADFKKTHVAETAAEKELLKLVCYSLLNIERARADSKSTAKEVEQLQKLMKSLAVSPDQLNAANSGKNLETYGLKIKYIEEHLPGELLDELESQRYEDIDGYERYYENFLRRPTINYNADLANYMIVNDDGEEEDWEIKD